MQIVCEGSDDREKGYRKQTSETKGSTSCCFQICTLKPDSYFCDGPGTTVPDTDHYWGRSINGLRGSSNNCSPDQKWL